MIVYADAVEEQRPAVVLDRIAALTRALPEDDPGAAQDRLRTALLLAGQLEQGVRDRLPALMPEGEARRQIGALHTLAARLAEGLLAAARAPGGRRAVNGARLLEGIARAVEQAMSVADVALPLRTPEGPAFHALYPEQYIDAAQDWARAHGGAPGAAAVVGIRGAGTALAAVVAAALRASGRQVVVLSCRPDGDPSARRAEIDPAELAGARFGLVVDDGPGISGSSMASVGEALVRAGVARGEVSFFPGHTQLPRHMTSDEVRAWWLAVPRYVNPLSRVRLGGRPLPQALAAALAPAENAAGPDGDQVELEDLGGGRWRAYAYAAPSAWPAACAPFERPKLRLSIGGRRFLFSFAGLGPGLYGVESAGERFAALLAARADGGWAVAPAVVAHGFVAVPWLEATPLAHRDLDPALVEHLGRYIAAVAQPELSADEQRAAIARLVEMVRANVGELLGRDAAERATSLHERVAAQLPASPRAYGDGRLSPHHFLRTLAGRILKAGGVARDADRTVVGKQAVLWDLAGANVEWGLDAESARALLAAYRAAGGDGVQPGALRFYELAYAAFRAGQIALCATTAPEADGERERLERARAFYCAAIERALFNVR